MKPDRSPNQSSELEARTTVLQRLQEATHSESVELPIISHSRDQADSQIQLKPGDQVGKYVIRSPLGVGGMGTVYLAFDPLIEREVALKLLTSSSSGATDSVLRFLQEARAIGRLSHPNVVSIYDIDQWNGHYFIVMELLAGGSLAQKIRQQGALPWQQACQICLQAAEGLAAAHRANLVHRDIKPENLMFHADATVKVVDFGLSKMESDPSDSSVPLTKVGYMLGTPHYMSPEQFESSTIDARSDIYSLGVTLFQLLTGNFPFHQAKTVVQLMNAHLTKPVPAVSELNPEIPRAIDAIVFRAMAKAPDARYQTANDFADALRQLIEPISKSAMPRPQLHVAIPDQPLKNALVVEPSKMQATMQVTALQRVGVSTAVASTMTQARQQFELNRPDMLMTAMQLDDGSGLELITYLHSRGLLKNVCTILNSQDSSMADLLAATDGTENVVLANKKAKVEDLIRLLHSSSVYWCESPTWLVPVEPSNQKMVIFTENGAFPASMTELIRASGVLDISLFPGSIGRSDYQPSARELRLVVRDSQDSSSDATFFCKLLEPFAAEAIVTAAIQIDAAGPILRAVSYRGLLATTVCPLNQPRLRRLLESCAA